MLTLIRCPFHPPRVTAVARKRPRSFCQKCRWQVTPKHAYALDPSKSEWADFAVVQAECRNLSGNELTRNLSGNTRSQSSQLAEPLWTDPGLNCGISLRELISTEKKKKSAGGDEWSNILPKSSHARKKPPRPSQCYIILGHNNNSNCFLDLWWRIVPDGTKFAHLIYKGFRLCQIPEQLQPIRTPQTT